MFSSTLRDNLDPAHTYAGFRVLPLDTVSGEHGDGECLDVVCLYSLQLSIISTYLRCALWREADERIFRRVAAAYSFILGKRFEERQGDFASTMADSRMHSVSNSVPLSILCSIGV